MKTPLKKHREASVAETIDWARALCGFDVNMLVDNPDVVRTTLSCLLKTTEDQQFVSGQDIEAFMSKSA